MRTLDDRIRGAVGQGCGPRHAQRREGVRVAEEAEEGPLRHVEDQPVRRDGGAVGEGEVYGVVRRSRLHFHELVEFQRGRCGDDMKCVRPDQEMRALYRFLRRHPCIGLALDPVRGGRPRAQPVVFVVARTECE